MDKINEVEEGKSSFQDPAEAATSARREEAEPPVIVEETKEDDEADLMSGENRESVPDEPFTTQAEATDRKSVV